MDSLQKVASWGILRLAQHLFLKTLTACACDSPNTSSQETSAETCGFLWKEDSEHSISRPGSCYANS